MLQQNQLGITQNSTDIIERKASIMTKHNTRFSMGTIRCYIQALGLPQCRNLIN